MSAISDAMKQQEAWGKIAEESKSDRERKPGEKTIREFMDESGGLSYTKARNHLEKLVQSERLTKRKALINGKWAWVYSPVI
jgi:hypothetical protein